MISDALSTECYQPADPPLPIDGSTAVRYVHEMRTQSVQRPTARWFRSRRGCRSVDTQCLNRTKDRRKVKEKPTERSIIKKLNTHPRLSTHRSASHTARTTWYNRETHKKSAYILDNIYTRARRFYEVHANLRAVRRDGGGWVGAVSMWRG